MQDKDKKLYTQIWNTYQPFTSPTRLHESLRIFDTHTQNEAINTYIAKCAPKTKAYGMTISLTNRVTIAIGISDFGAEKH